MAGEVLSYGAFGAFNTKYTRSKSGLQNYSYKLPQRKPTDSWKTFLPDVADSVRQFQADSRIETVEYDHERHAGLKGNVNVNVYLICV